MRLDLESLYRVHYRLVTWIVRASQVPHSAVDDVVQEVFITAYRRRAKAPPGDLRPWLIGIAKGVSYSHRRRAARLRVREGAWLAVTNESIDVDRQVEDRRDLEIVLRAIDQLDEPQRDVFVLVVLHGLPPVDVARLLGVQRNTVYGRLHFAREKLRDLPLNLRDRARTQAEPSGEQLNRGWLALLAKVSRGGMLATWGAAMVASAMVGAGIAWAGTAHVIPPEPRPAVTEVRARVPSPEARAHFSERSTTSREALVLGPSPRLRLRSAMGSASAEPVRPRAPELAPDHVQDDAPIEVSRSTLGPEVQLLSRAAVSLDSGDVAGAARFLDEYEQVFAHHGALREEHARLRELHLHHERTRDRR